VPKTYIIAEAACNHECDMAVAKRMIVAAHNAGADAIKFQTYKADKLVTEHAMSYWGEVKTRQLYYYRQLDKFGKKEYAELFKYAKKVGIDAFSTPFDEESATMLAELGVPFMKVASCELTNIGLLRHIAKLGLPVIMSTGGCKVDEIRRAESLFSKVPLTIMACVLSNPATEACLNRIHFLKYMYPYLGIGYSDHTTPESTLVPMMAVAAGAKMLEKHFTIDKSMSISNHFFAADIKQFEAMVAAVRSAEGIMGDYDIYPIAEEEGARVAAARSWHAATDIKKGEVIGLDNIVYLRPGDGLRYDNRTDIIGRKATADLWKGKMLEWEDLGNGD